MKLFDKHICGFSRIVLVLFFLASSGLTVVLYDCRMTDEMCGMSCCIGTSGCASGVCGTPDAPQTRATWPVTVNQPCQTATVVGGNQTEPTIIEKQWNGLQIIKTSLLPIAVFETAIGSSVDPAAFRINSTASNVSPPSVETYVLNASFLI